MTGLSFVASGFPTGVGALVLKTQAASELRKHYWGGGTVSVAGAGRTVSEELRVFKGSAARFEDGTVAFLGIAALRQGFEALERVGGMRLIERHTSGLQVEMQRRLKSLMLGDGWPTCHVKGNYPLS